MHICNGPSQSSNIMVPLFDQADINIGITLQHANYAFIAIACLWVYDFALTLDKDAAFILDAPWRIPKLTYLTSRYLPFALVVTDMFRILQPGLSLKLDKSQSCTTLFAFNTYVGGIVLFCAESLFIQRVLAVTGLRRLIVGCNIVLFLVPVAVTLTLYNSSSPVMQSPIPKVASCYDSKQSRIVIVAYILLVIVEIEILSFMLYHSWNLYREHRNDIPLVRALVRHNLLYFACGLLFSTMAVVVVLTLPASYSEAISGLQFMIHGILATRLHRELYNTAHHETSTGNVSLPLVFAPASLEMQPDPRGPSSL
ncbi:uncharacterized protein BJ212DRAFT_979711 [Suillus subaureus]|uniref:DUF6533 domain-containing protein n=1 Tax=Suillus subaureus TaxID=48587 RepID=A0A9P7EGG6_9AGAM|nr:uncharacterized protein BJ212DRAFT_979711 [Suillus subaureus]KAG1821106.1 hypothetical protein BJ212DRAFT_979711 [Suillus subaureus]